MAADFVGWLQLAVDAAIALLNPTGVPGQIKMEKVGAVRLKVQPLAGGVCGEQNAQRVFSRVGVKSALDLLAIGALREAVDHLNALFGAIGTLNGLL